MITYILEIIVFQAVFLGIYLVFLRNETFFEWNRAYLLVTAILAFALPFVELEVFAAQVRIPQQIQEFAPVFIGATPVETVQTAHETATLPHGFWWMLIYALGVVFSLGILFRKYHEVRRYFRFKRKENQSIIMIPNSDAAFTFLNTIFLGEKLDVQTRNHILAHEQVHVHQKHGLDLLFFELLRALFWFNPLIYAYQKSISEVHEYLADAQAAKITEPKTYYNQLLNTAFGTQDISFINTFFNHSLIKKRIVMLQKHSKTTAKWKYLLFIPVLAGMVTYVGCSTDNNPENTEASSLEEQIADLQATIDAKDELSDSEKQNIRNLVYSYIAKSAKSKTDISVKVEESKNEKDGDVANVPFAVIEQVPVYPGCEDLEGNDAKKICMSEHISEFVNKNFDTSLGKKLGLTGIIKIYVQFKIDQTGEIIPMGARGPVPELEDAAIALVKKLPKMKPGKQKGQEVGVLYALPIVFNVPE